MGDRGQRRIDLGTVEISKTFHLSAKQQKLSIARQKTKTAVDQVSFLRKQRGSVRAFGTQRKPVSHNAGCWQR